MMRMRHPIYRGLSLAGVIVYVIVIAYIKVQYTIIVLS